MKKPSIKKNFIYNSLLTLSNILFPIITFPYVSRVVGPVGTGKVSFATSVIFYFNIFAQLGIPTYGIKICAKVRDDREKLTKTVKELLLINLVMAAVTYAALSISVFTVPRFREPRTLLIITSATILLSAIGMDWLYKALEQYSYITIRSIIFQLLALAALFLLVHAESDYLIYGAITVVASGAANLVNFAFAGRYISWKYRCKLEPFKHLRHVLIYFMMAIATTIYTNLDIVMLGFMKSDLDVGYYNAAVKIKTLLLGFVTALGTVVLPRVSRYVEQGRMEEFYRVSKKAFEFVVLLSASVSIYFMLYANEGILFLSGDKYAGSVLPMQIIMPTLFLIGLTNLSGIQMLIPLGREKVVLASEVAGAVVDLVINWVLIPKYASAGAAIGTLVAEIVVLLIQFFCLRKTLFPLLRTLPWGKILLSLAAATAAAWACKLIPVTSSFLRLLISAVIFYAVYLALLNLLKEQFVLETEKEVFQKLLGKKEKTC